jgi:hypothetical protein
MMAAERKVVKATVREVRMVGSMFQLIFTEPVTLQEGQEVQVCIPDHVACPDWVRQAYQTGQEDWTRQVYRKDPA